MAVQRIGVVLGPTVKKVEGKLKWIWQVAYHMHDGEQKDVAYPSRKVASAAARSAILEGIEKGFIVYGRSVDQTGGGKEATYHPDGRMTEVRDIAPEDGYVGPRCFDLPVTLVERKRRSSKIRKLPKESGEPAAPKAPRKRKAAPAEPAAPKTRKKSEPKAKPTTGKRAKTKPTTAEPKGDALGRQYLDEVSTIDQAKRWLSGRPGHEIARITRHVDTYGTTEQRLLLAEARGKLKLEKSKKATPAAPATPPKKKFKKESVKRTKLARKLKPEPKPKPEPKVKPKAVKPKPEPKPKPASAPKVSRKKVPSPAAPAEPATPPASEADMLRALLEQQMSILRDA